MHRNDWPVLEHGIRPAGKPTECFYCGAERGAVHRNECVIRSRTVVVRTIVEHVIDVPESFEVENIEFTEGSSCSNNMIRQLQDLTNRLDDEGKCTCGMVTREYVREATPEDENESALFVTKLPT
jgi:hypothetical protein